MVCPLIEESNKIDHSSKLKIWIFKKNFPNKVDILHGKTEKIEGIKKNSRRKIKILVSTTIIEVGIDFPNET